MRMLALPAAILVALCLYLPLPKAEAALLSCVRVLYARFAPRVQRQPLPIFLLLLGSAASLLGAVHPVASALVMAPLFSAFAVLPNCAHTKHVLDSGKYARDIPTYEAHVRAACQTLAPAFVTGAIAPLLLCAVGMPLYIGCGLGWVFFALRTLHEGSINAQRSLVLVLRASDRVLLFLMLLSSGLVGRNPLRTRGKDSKSRLPSILGIAGDSTDTHAPMAGDISQGTFLCCFCTGLLAFILTVIGLIL